MSMRTAQPWLVTYPSDNAQSRRLIAFTCAGGGPAGFRELAGALAPYASLSVVQLPGREARLREAPIDEMSTLVGLLSLALADELGDGPLGFFGHSMGAQLAYRVARALKADHGRGPGVVIVSSAQPAHLPRAGKIMHTLDDHALADALLAMGGTPARVLADSELRAILLRAARADFSVIERAHPVPVDPLEVPLVVYGGHGDRAIASATLAGWRDLSSVGFKQREFPGGHFYYQSHAQEVASALREDLDLFL